MKPGTLKKPFVVLFSGFIVLMLSVSPSFSFSLPPVERETLDNGLRIVVSEDHSLPFVTFQVIVDGGSRLDPPLREGLSYLTAKGLLHGTSRYTARQLSYRLDFLGANLSATSSEDYLSVSLRALKKDFLEGWNFLMDAVIHPAFPEDEFRLEKLRTLGAIKAEDETPGTLSRRTFAKALFAATPYGHPVMGTEDSLGRLTRTDLVTYHDAYIRPNNAILVVVGDITLKEIKQHLLDRLESWPAGGILPVFSGQKPSPGIKLVTAERGTTQANLVLGNVVPPRNNPDYFPMVVMNYILGGGSFSSRLFAEIRAKRGFAYSVNSGFDFKKYAGSFAVTLQTKNASAREAVTVILEEMRKIQREPVTDRELEGAVKYLTGSFPLRLDTQAKLAGFLAQVEFYQLGADYGDTYASRVRAVTKDDIQRAAVAHLRPDNYVLAVVGNLKEGGFSDDSPFPQ